MAACQRPQPQNVRTPAWRLPLSRCWCVPAAAPERMRPPARRRRSPKAARPAGHVVLHDLRVADGAILLKVLLEVGCGGGQTMCSRSAAQQHSTARPRRARSNTAGRGLLPASRCAGAAARGPCQAQWLTLGRVGRQAAHKDFPRLGLLLLGHRLLGVYLRAPACAAAAAAGSAEQGRAWAAGASLLPQTQGCRRPRYRPARAASARTWRPSMTWMSCTTWSATARSLKVTKPKPRGRMVARSRMTTAAGVGGGGGG